MPHRLVLVAAVVLAGCQGPVVVVADTNSTTGSAVLSTHQQHERDPRPYELVPTGQLNRVKRATARYRDIRHAIDDGYVDIDVVIANMGRHFLKDSLLDAKFELERPELLVYSEREKGRMELVAVEYAVPLSLSEKAPEGFRGAADEWFADRKFQLWTLHAWVWKENPDGAFNPTNHRVP